MNPLLPEVAALIALSSTATFAGAALHVSLVQYPARARLGAHAALVQWVHSYHGAPLLQTPVAAIGCIAAIVTASCSANPAWMIAALLIGFVVPFTKVVMPTGKSLFGPCREPESKEIWRLMHEWGSLHAVRTLLSLAAALLMLWAFISRALI